VLLSANSTLALVSARVERVSRRIEDSFIIALFDSMKKDETKKNETNRRFVLKMYFLLLESLHRFIQKLKVRRGP
jgi:hypothetical protein